MSGKKWTQYEMMILYTLSEAGDGPQDIAEELGRSVKSVKHKKKLMNIPFKSRGGRRPDVYKRAALLNLLADHSLRQTSKILNVSLWTIRITVRRLSKEGLIDTIVNGKRIRYIPSKEWNPKGVENASQDS